MADLIEQTNGYGNPYMIEASDKALAECPECGATLGQYTYMARSLKQVFTVCVTLENEGKEVNAIWKRIDIGIEEYIPKVENQPEEER